MREKNKTKLERFFRRVLNIGFASAIAVLLLVSAIVWALTIQGCLAFFTGLLAGFSLIGGSIAFAIVSIQIAASLFLFRLLRDLVTEFRLNTDALRASSTGSE